MSSIRQVTGRSKVRYVVIVGLIGLFMAVGLARTTDPGVRSAYQRQFQKLDFDDVSGHYKLALWCRDQGAWELLKQQCNHVLTLEPDHEQAQLLLELADAKLAAQSPDDAEESNGSSQSSTVTAAGVKLLTDEQVQMVKRELLDHNRPERVRVRFHNDVEDKYWSALAARENLDDRSRPRFFRQPPAVRAWQMLSAIRNQGYDESMKKDIEIVNDPMLMRTYITDVWPVIRQGCATSGCHGGEDAKGIALIAGGVMTDAAHYTNFMILDHYSKDGERLINRDRPENSLLLTYGQPRDETPSSRRHPTDIRPLFSSLSNPAYRKVRAWLQRLVPPTPDYGFELEFVKP